MKPLEVAKPFLVLVALPTVILLGLWLVGVRHSRGVRYLPNGPYLPNSKYAGIGEGVGEEADTLFVELSEPWQPKPWHPRRTSGD